MQPIYLAIYTSYIIRARVRNRRYAYILPYSSGRFCLSSTIDRLLRFPQMGHDGDKQQQGEVVFAALIAPLTTFNIHVSHLCPSQGNFYAADAIMFPNLWLSIAVPFILNNHLKISALSVLLKKTAQERNGKSVKIAKKHAPLKAPYRALKHPSKP